MTDTRGKHWHLETCWDDLEPIPARGGILTQRFVLGAEDDGMAPVVFRAVFPPGCRVEPHTHTSDYVEIILEGSEEVTRKWRHAGDITIVKGGTVYGPLIAGPEGVTKLIIFRDGRYPVVSPSQANAVVG